MKNKLDGYTDVAQRLVNETVACAPEEWIKGVLTVEPEGPHIKYQLRNGEQAAASKISEKLRDLIDEMLLRMTHRGDAWTQASISFFQEGNELKFSTAFEYAATAPCPL